MKIIWSPEALEDVGRPFDLALLNPVAAKLVVESLFVAAESLINFPQRGRIGSKPGTRELVVQTPYVIVYRIAGDTVDILRVWHAAQER